MRDFEEIPIGDAMNFGTPLQSNRIRDVVKNFGPDAFCFANTQQDAEELLGCLVNGINDEMLKAMALARPQGSKETPLSKIFMGRLRSTIRRVGDRTSESSQPFLTLPLNITVSRIHKF